MGGALLAQMGGMLAVQTLAFAAAALLAPGLAGQPVFLWTISLVSAYGVGFPLFCLVIRPLPAAPGNISPRCVPLAAERRGFRSSLSLIVPSTAASVLLG